MVVAEDVKHVAVACGQTVTLHCELIGLMLAFEGMLTEYVPVPLRLPLIGALELKTPPVHV
jgi:hypothetical protein